MTRGDADIPTANLAKSAAAAPLFDVLAIVSCAYVVVVVLGFGALRTWADVLPAGASRNADRMLFTAANAATLTGFQQSFASVGDYPPRGRAVVAALNVAGAILSVFGGGYFLARAFDGIVRPGRLAAAGAVFVVAGLLASNATRGGPAIAFDAVSAATHSGLAASRGFTPASASTQALLVPALALASLAPFVVVRHRERWLWLSAVAVAYVVGLGVLMLAGTGATAASAWAVNARGAGLPIGSVGDLSAGGQFALLPLMLVGAMPAGVAGGLSVLPIALVVRGAWLAFRGKPAGPFVGIAAVWVALTLLLIFGVQLALLAGQPQVPPDRLLFITVSAVANVGLSHDPLSLTGDGLTTLTFAMLAGRLLPIAMLCWMAGIHSPQRHDGHDEYKSNSE